MTLFIQIIRALFPNKSQRRFYAQGLSVSQEAMLDLIFAWFLKQGLARPTLIEPLDDRAVFVFDQALLDRFEAFVVAGVLDRRNLVGNHGPTAKFGYQEAGRFKWSFQFIVHRLPSGNMELEVDIDKYRPTDLAGLITHGLFEVLWHKLTKSKTKSVIAKASRKDLFTSVG